MFANDFGSVEVENVPLHQQQVNIGTNFLNQLFYIFHVIFINFISILNIF